MQIPLRSLCAMLLLLALYHSAGQATEPTPASTATATPADAEPRTDLGKPFTPEEKAQLTARVLAPSSTPGKVIPPRRKVISVSVPADTEALPRAKSRRLARLVVFNYAEGKAASLLVDASTAEVLATAPIRGRPQASEEEKQEARKIIRRDPELDRLLQNNAVVEGGFIVDGPRGSPRKNRFLQLQLLSSDRLHLQRTVTVDLTAQTIATSKASD